MKRNHEAREERQDFLPFVPAIFAAFAPFVVRFLEETTMAWPTTMNEIRSAMVRLRSPQVW
jgi:hypothetical protein